MVAHYICTVSSRFDNSRFTCRKAGVVVKHIYLRELRIELTAKGFDYCFDTAYDVERSLLNNLHAKPACRRAGDSTEY